MIINFDFVFFCLASWSCLTVCVICCKTSGIYLYTCIGGSMRLAASLCSKTWPAVDFLSVSTQVLDAVEQRRSCHPFRGQWPLDVMVKHLCSHLALECCLFPCFFVFHWKGHLWLACSVYVLLQDGKSLSALAVSAYLAYSKVFTQPKTGLILYGRQRFPEGHRGLVLPSHKRWEGQDRGETASCFGLLHCLASEGFVTWTHHVLV